MAMKKSALLIALVSLLGLTSCDTFTTPTGTIRLFGLSLQKTDPELYTRALTGEALEKCGTLHGMMNIQDELRKFKNTTYSEPVFVSSQSDPLARIIQDNYEVTIEGSNPEIPYALNWKFTVECLTTWTTTWDPINHGNQDSYRKYCNIAKMVGPFCGAPN